MTSAPEGAPNPGDIVAVIPAAGLGARLMPISSALPKAMVPIGGQPLISLTVNNLIRQGIRDFVVVVGKHGDQIREYLERTYCGDTGVSIRCVEQPELNGPLGALRVAVRSLEGPARPILVWLGDTLSHDELDFSRDFILVQQVSDHWRWCLARPGADGLLDSLVDKPTGPTDANLALIGVYFFRDGRLLADAIEEVFAAGETLAGEYQLSSAIARYNARQGIAVVSAREWHDCGSIDRYIATRRELIQSRSFNQITVDETGVLRKQATNGGDELRDEIAWYDGLPGAVLPLTPRVFRSSRDPADTYLEVEYVTTPTLAEVYLYANVHHEVWEYAIRQILGLWRDRLYAVPQPVDDSRRRIEAMYWEKTISRLARAASVLPPLDEPVSLNGVPLAPWDRLAPLVRARIDDLARSAAWRITHGDFHFGNLLFDFHSGQLKMIDPRGSFGGPGIGGDARYDLAKFLHSFRGGYAHLAADMFRLERTSGAGPHDYSLQLFGGSSRAFLESTVRSWTEEAGFDHYDLMLIEGLAFLSLTAMHDEYPARQVAAYLTGLSLVQSALNQAEPVNAAHAAS